MDLVREWVEFQAYKRKYRSYRLRFRQWRHQRFLDLVAFAYRQAKRVERWAEPRLQKGRPETIYPIGRDRYSRL